MKKVMYLFVAVAMFGFAACGGSETTNEAEAEAPAAEAEAPAAEAEAPADHAEAPADDAEAPADDAE